MPRDGGASSTPQRQPFSATRAAEYWIRPVNPGDDSSVCGVRVA